MVHAHTDPSCVLGQIVYTIRGGTTEFGNDKIMHANFLGFPLRTQLPSAVLEVSHQFLLLRVHRNHRLLTGQEALDFAIDVFKLPIPVGMAVAFLALPIALQTVALFP